VLLLPMIGGPAGGVVMVMTPAAAGAAGVAGAAGMLGLVSSCAAGCVVLGSKGGYEFCANCFGLYLYLQAQHQAQERAHRGRACL
jgi:hypothetical protein